jgi:hypothetical protein
VARCAGAAAAALRSPRGATLWHRRFAAIDSDANTGEGAATFARAAGILRDDCRGGARSFAPDSMRHPSLGETGRRRSWPGNVGRSRGNHTQHGARHCAGADGAIPARACLSEGSASGTASRRRDPRVMPFDEAAWWSTNPLGRPDRALGHGTLPQRRGPAAGGGHGGLDVACGKDARGRATWVRPCMWVRTVTRTRRRIGQVSGTNALAFPSEDTSAGGGSNRASRSVLVRSPGRPAPRGTRRGEKVLVRRFAADGGGSMARGQASSADGVGGRSERGPWRSGEIIAPHRSARGGYGGSCTHLRSPGCRPAPAGVARWSLP